MSKDNCTTHHLACECINADVVELIDAARAVVYYYEPDQNCGAYPIDAVDLDELSRAVAKVERHGWAAVSKMEIDGGEE